MDENELKNIHLQATPRAKFNFGSEPNPKRNNIFIYLTIAYTGKFENIL